MSQLSGHNQSILADKSLACGPNPPLTSSRKRDVAGAGVAAVQGPLCLAVADEENAGCGHGCAQGAWSKSIPV